MPQLCENSQNKLGEDFGELWRILEGFENFPKFSSSFYNIYSQNKENLIHKLFPYPPNLNFLPCLMEVSKSRGKVGERIKGHMVSHPLHGV
jgi:hypothetical protein